MTILIGQNTAIYPRGIQMTNEDCSPPKKWWYSPQLLALAGPAAAWPRPKIIGADAWGMMGETSHCCSRWFEYPFTMLISGNRTHYYINGVTRDSVGDPLPNCIVQGFRTSDDLFIRETEAVLGGEFVLCLDEEVAHYMVAYKPGSPDVGGTTLNTLVPDLTRLY